jgi:hypothetical protein
MKKTAVDLFAEKYNLVGTFEYEEAKELERQQIEIEKCKAKIELLDNHKGFEINEEHIKKIKVELLCLELLYNQMFKLI